MTLPDKFPRNFLLLFYGKFGHKSGSNLCKNLPFLFSMQSRKCHPYASNCEAMCLIVRPLCFMRQILWKSLIMRHPRKFWQHVVFLRNIHLCSTRLLFMKNTIKVVLPFWNTSNFWKLSWRNKIFTNHSALDVKSFFLYFSWEVGFT